MGTIYDEVIISHSDDEKGSVITINCPDKTGLGCDLCRIILSFGLSIVKGDVSTDGKWCYIVFWVVGNDDTRWVLLKNRLLEVCPSYSSVSGISFYQSEVQLPKPSNIFLLKLCCHDRKGLLHDVTKVLCHLELTIKKVKVSTTPDGRVLDLFFVTDTRELLHTSNRQNDTKNLLLEVIGLGLISFDMEMVGPEIAACSQDTPFLPTSITEDALCLRVSDDLPNSRSFSSVCSSSGSWLTSQKITLTMDNWLSPSHTLIQISCQDHKGLLYDAMRTLKDCNIQVSYGSFSTKSRGACKLDLFTMQADGKKITDSNKQKELATRLTRELQRPVRVAVVTRGPDTELLVANPVELSGKGRPLVFHDIALSLKMLDACVFLAEIRRHMIGDREFEVYRILLDEAETLSVSRSNIDEAVWKTLMGWQHC